MICICMVYLRMNGKRSAIDDNIIITTKKGIVIRTPMTNIRIMGRATQGVRIIKLKDGDRVSDLARVPVDDVIVGE